MLRIATFVPAAKGVMYLCDDYRARPLPPFSYLTFSLQIPIMYREMFSPIVLE
jgi:hypothetical protein